MAFVGSRRVAECGPSRRLRSTHQEGRRWQAAGRNPGLRKPEIKTPRATTTAGRPIEELIRWRLWDRTGAGLMAELGSHQFDAAGIFIAAAHDGKSSIPSLSVTAASDRPLFPPDRDTEDHVYCIIEFPAPGYDPPTPFVAKRIGVQYASINGNGFGGYGETVFGTEGTLVLEVEREAMLFKGSDTAGKTKVVGRGGKESPTLDTEAAATPSRRPSALARARQPRLRRGAGHWAWCIRHPRRRTCRAAIRRSPWATR